MDPAGSLGTNCTHTPVGGGEWQRKHVLPVDVTVLSVKVLAPRIKSHGFPGRIQTSGGAQDRVDKGVKQKHRTKTGLGSSSSSFWLGVVTFVSPSQQTGGQTLGITQGVDLGQNPLDLGQGQAMEICTRVQSSEGNGPWPGWVDKQRRRWAQES